MAEKGGKGFSVGKGGKILLSSLFYRTFNPSINLLFVCRGLNYWVFLVFLFLDQNFELFIRRKKNNQNAGGVVLKGF